MTKQQSYDVTYHEVLVNHMNMGVNDVTVAFALLIQPVSRHPKAPGSVTFHLFVGEHKKLRGHISDSGGSCRVSSRTMADNDRTYPPAAHTSHNRRI